MARLLQLNLAGGVLLFPFIRLFAPFRHYLIGFVFIALFGYQMSLLITPPAPPIHSADPRLADVVAYENLLQQKAESVLHRFDTSSHTIDLSVCLDHTTITTTTFDPGHSMQGCADRGHDPLDCDELSESKTEEVSDAPRVRKIKVCVTLSKSDNIDKDRLFRALSYSLGIDLSRGDMLRLVYL
jgi:hypothetical protein